MMPMRWPIEIVLLAGTYFAADGRSTVAKRKARVATMLKAMQQAEKAFDIVNAMMIDDPDFVQRPGVGLVLGAPCRAYLPRQGCSYRRAGPTRGRGTGGIAGTWIIQLGYS